MGTGPIGLILQALWLFLPAYFANMAPVFAAKVFPALSEPIDGGRLWKDGRPVLGPSKTWRGLWAGCLVGSATAASQGALLLAFPQLPDWDDFGLGHHLLVPFLLGAGLGLGAGVGDTVKSFFKRRTGRAGGKPWFPFDQLDFVVGAIVFAYVMSWVSMMLTYGGLDWFGRNFLTWDRWLVWASLFLLTPGLHYIVNVIGFRLKLKQVPW